MNIARQLSMPIAAGAAVVLLSSAALAQPGSDAPKDGFYAMPSFGLLVPRGQDMKESGLSASLDYDTGWTAGIAGGYRFGQVRVEGELSYGRVSGADLTINGQDFDVGADLSLFTGTLAGYYDFIHGPVTPYVGAGIGVAVADLDDFSINGIGIDGGGSSTDLMLFGEAGLSWALTDQLSVVPAYRYVWVNDGGDGVDDSTAHVVRVGLRYQF